MYWVNRMVIGSIEVFYRDTVLSYASVESDLGMRDGLREELKGADGCMQIPANLVSWSC